MVIYLDNCVLQDFKKEENSDFLKAILEDKEKNIYCYSEAHIFDLIRDKSNIKYEDAEFIEKIVEDNYWCYCEKTTIHPSKPLDNLIYFENNSDDNILELFNDELLSPFVIALKMIPFNVYDTQLPFPEDYNSTLRQLFENSTNLYEFMENMLTMTYTLQEDQKEFKELTKYLHNTVYAPLLEAIGIKGYSAEGITDKIIFRDSYLDFHTRTYPDRKFYERFIDMYFGLEMFGFVKGRPRKQKMMNLINDARHAFFGAHCDMVVSKDIDFINKTNFIYDIFDISIPVYTVEEFKQLLMEKEEISFNSLINDISHIKFKEEELNYIKDEIIAETKLSQTYINYFDTVIFVENKFGTYYFLTKKEKGYFKGTLIKEIKIVTNIIVSMFGKDIQNNGEFEKSEIDENQKWQGRGWNFEQVFIQLNYQQRIQLAFYPKQYLENARNNINNRC